MFVDRSIFIDQNQHHSVLIVKLKIGRMRSTLLTNFRLIRTKNKTEEIALKFDNRADDKIAAGDVFEDCIARIYSSKESEKKLYTFNFNEKNLKEKLN